MKTKILKWDVDIQLFLVAINTVLLSLSLFLRDFAYAFLLLQFVEGAYQLMSSGINLLLNHKSLGFAELRRLHFFGSIAYLVVLFGVVTIDLSNALLAIALFIIVPQIIFYCYFLLCRRELQFLINREFHILR